MSDTLLLKPVFSRPATTLPKGIQLPPGWQHLAWHQAQTLLALDDPEVDIIVNTAMTGDGKSLAAYLGVLTRRLETIGLYPTNELARDQEGQVRGYIRQFAPSWEPRLVRLSGPELEVYAREAGLRKGTVLSGLGAQREVLLTNPDIFHYLHRGAYITQKDSPDRLWQRFDSDFELLFHVFGPPQVAAVLNTLLLMRCTMGRKKFMFLSATPDPQLIERLRLAGFNVREIDPKAADCYRSPEDEAEAQALAAQGWRRVSRGLELEFIRLEPSPRASEAWLRENAPQILEYFRVHSGSRGAIILNSIASVKRLLPHFQAVFATAGLTVRENTGLTGATARRASLEADLVTGTSTIDVGVDFKINFLIFESSDAGNFIQRLGRLGRHDGYESPSGFVPFDYFKAIALAPNFFVERLFDGPEASFVAGGTFDRFFLNEQIHTHYRRINEFSGYYKRWGAIQSLKIAYKLGHSTVKAQYAEAKAAFSDACRQVFDVEVLPLFGRVKAWEREWHEQSGQKGNPIFDVATSFRGSGDLPASATPFSSRICTPRSAARARILSSATVWRIESARRSCVRRARAIGVGPAPSAATRAPQKGWSMVKGTTRAGTPARSAAPVVPAPPWCTTAVTRGKSQSLGRASAKNTSSAQPREASPPHPQSSTARTPALRTAPSTSAVTAAGSSFAMLPKPILTTGPSRVRKTSSAGDGFHVGGAGSTQYPVTCRGRSLCTGTCST
nr:type I-D CRISPR-associated helicase Cas3' [Gloeobacter violaceus]